MGDVIAITESDGEIICEYVYDEWGKHIEINYIDGVTEQQIALSNANPLRYRGYYYDTETEYYYLQSRYYDPSICRFINADIPEVASMSRNFTVGTNLFAYCNNEPVNNSDPDGHSVLLFTIAGYTISIGSVIAIVAFFSFLFAYATNIQFRNAINGIIYLLVDKTIEAVKSFANAITSIVRVSRISRKYYSYERHHIVAKKDRRASDSRYILDKNNININDRCNLVSIRKTFHKHLHTNAYHKAVYYMLQFADQGKNKTVKRYMVMGCLMFMGFVLKGAGELCR